MAGSTLSQLARNLRNNATPQEKKLLFRFLRNFPLPIHRQFVIENTIVDFYCHQAKLAIEIDGSQHLKPKQTELDAKRRERLHELGIDVLRFTNSDIDLYFELTCVLIIEKVEERIGKPVVWL
jgi:very-short-patch-repair endonuclease